MSYFWNLTVVQMGFWLTWAAIPLLVEIIPAIVSAYMLVRRHRRKEQLEIPAKLPFISVIIPVYNSEETLFACIQSINESTYPSELIQIILADNQSTDDSFAAYANAQNNFNLNMQYIHTEQGKAKALNSAIYQCIGTYIINIDSDGILEPHALMNMVLHFENDIELAALTGTILPQKEMIKATKSWPLRVLRKTEYFEYAQAFLSGRSIESENNQLFTMSGAFSAFRKETLMQTFMYSTTTVGEDTDMTFQIRERLKSKVLLCDDAIFYIEPIEGLSQLYLQRQRWQRGEMEVARAYMQENAEISKFFTNFLVRRIIIDHTFIFPKMIWIFASVVLIFFRYSPVILGLSYVVIYGLYVFISLLNFWCVELLLKPFPAEKHFYHSVWWTILTMPLYNFWVSWIRLIGIVNSMTGPGQWNARGFGQELRSVWQIIKADIKSLKRPKE